MLTQLLNLFQLRFFFFSWICHFAHQSVQSITSIEPRLGNSKQRQIRGPNFDKNLTSSKREKGKHTLLPRSELHFDSWRESVERYSVVFCGLQQKLAKESATGGYRDLHGCSYPLSTDWCQEAWGVAKLFAKLLSGKEWHLCMGCFPPVVYPMFLFLFALAFICPTLPLLFLPKHKPFVRFHWGAEITDDKRMVRTSSFS